VGVDAHVTCPLCAGRETFVFLHRPRVPVHQNLLHETGEAARAAVRGELEMRACPGCGFVFNGAFDSGLLEYGERYENSQNASPVFSAYVDTLVRRLSRLSEFRSGEILEIGCGNGAFLRRLLTQPGVAARGIGIDPAYVGPESMLGGRLRFERSLYVPGASPSADAVVCRHVVEHVPRPLQLLRDIASAAHADQPVRIFLETPCVEWILRGGVVWDFFYEHCSLFTPESLREALVRAGFGGVSVKRAFGDQYLCADATTAETESPTTRDAHELVALARARVDASTETRLAGVVAELAARGPTMIWGAGAKGATFCDIVDPDGSRLAGVVDVNPAKQGRFIPGTGHPILSPEDAVARGIMTAVVLNPNYVSEVAALLRRLGSGASVRDLTRELRCG
jgi:SAM-dependent methyltransferase